MSLSGLCEAQRLECGRGSRSVRARPLAAKYMTQIARIVSQCTQECHMVCSNGFPMSHPCADVIKDAAGI